MEDDKLGIRIRYYVCKLSSVDHIGNAHYANVLGLHTVDSEIAEEKMGVFDMYWGKRRLWILAWRKKDKFLPVITVVTKTTKELGL